MDFKNDINFRKQTLKKLLFIIQNSEKEILDALYKDFKKSEFESVVSETSYVISELKTTIKKLKSWSKPQKVMPSILNFPSSDYIITEPYGKVLIISPWNYPFQLALCPLIAAVAAGNQVTLKPSELTPNTASIISKIIRETFEVKHVVAITGDYKIAETLLKQHWDYIFFTGSIEVGKIVAKAAAENLTPVTLELGGKNPCVIDETSNLKLTAKRIVWGKFLNGGQTCIAPDYLIVHLSVKDKLTRFLIEEINLAYGENAEISPDYCRIINQKNWFRLNEFLKNETVLFGGKTSQLENYIEPTLLDNSKLDSLVMKEEIFGPILPILSYENENDLDKIISKYNKPLSLYVFSENKSFANKIIKKYSFGGGCINDVVVHFSNNRLPFGGVGNSGMGAYHGKRSFDTFSHKKGIVRKATWFDLPLRYAPYKNKLHIIKKVLNWL